MYPLGKCRHGFVDQVRQQLASLRCFEGSKMSNSSAKQVNALSCVSATMIVKCPVQPTEIVRE